MHICRSGSSRSALCRKARAGVREPEQGHDHLSDRRLVLRRVHVVAQLPARERAATTGNGTATYFDPLQSDTNGVPLQKTCYIDDRISRRTSACGRLPAAVPAAAQGNGRVAVEPSTTSSDRCRRWSSRCRRDRRRRRSARRSCVHGLGLRRAIGRRAVDGRSCPAAPAKWQLRNAEHDGRCDQARPVRVERRAAQGEPRRADGHPRGGLRGQGRRSASSARTSSRTTARRSRC